MNTRACVGSPGRAVPWPGAASMLEPAIKAHVVTAATIVPFMFGPPASSSSIFEDPKKGFAAELIEREPAQLERFILGDRAAIKRAQEIVQQPLSRRGIVEHVADECRLCGLLDERLQPFRGRAEPFEEECEHRDVTRGQLRRMQIPSL